MPIFVSILLAFVCSLALPVCSWAEAVGHFQKVEGQVDLFKQGKPPALAPKEKDGVEPGDVIRTKTQGRAQVKFVDDSVLTIAPGSRVAIETYMYDASAGTRKAVLQVFRGMVQTVVTKILRTQEAGFIMKTHTAVLGVRGTKWYALLRPNATDVYLEEGKLSVRNLFAEVGGEISLNAMEFTRIMANLAPTAAMPFQKQDLAPLERQLITGEGLSSNGGNLPPGSLERSAPLAFLDRFDLFDSRAAATDLRLSINRQPIINRDLLNRDLLLRRDLPSRPGRPGGGGSTGGGYYTVGGGT